MTDTAQPLAAADPVVAPQTLDQQLSGAVDAFKVATGVQAPRAREPNGQFASSSAPEAAEEEIEAEAPQGEAVETDEEQESGEEAAEEAQPDTVEMPSSWAKEDAEIWSALPPEAQAKIAEREGQRDNAVNQKFQEAANVRKANEALIAEASTNREKFIKAADDVLALVALDRPTPQQFGAGSAQGYDREGYDLAVAQYEQASQLIQTVRQQREQALAQHEAEVEAAEKTAFDEVESTFRPQLLKLVPDLAVADKAPGAIRAIAEYAMSQGIPESVFTDPKLTARITSPELTLAWKEMQYDRLQAAKGKVEPKAAKAPAPTLKAGAQTSRSAVKYQQQQKNLDRLSRDGSIEAGAAVFKDLVFR